MPAIPLRGDRSAWDAENYPLLHTNDTDTSSDSLHHTLGTSSSQAASGNHTHLVSSINSGSSTYGQLLTSLGSGSATWLSLINHSHSGSTSGSGGKLSWDSIWTDAVHTHTNDAEGGKLSIASLSSGAVVAGYVLTSDGSGSAVWSAPTQPANTLNDLTDVRAPSPNDGDVLTWNANSGSWVAYPISDWRVTLTQDDTVNDSDKTFTVPAITEWQILWIWVEYTSTSVEGARQLEIQLQDTSSNVIGQFQTGVTQGKELTYKYLFGIGVPDLTTPRDGNNITTPLPAGTFLATGQKIRVWDNNTIDASDDDMIVRLQYASRTFRVPDYFVLAISNPVHSQTADKITTTQSMNLLVVNNASQKQKSNMVVLSWRLFILENTNSTHGQTSDTIVLIYHDVLTVNNSVQSQTPDNITLTQYNVLGIHNATSKLTSNKLILQTNIIHNPEVIIQNSTQTQIAENITLTTLAPLSIDNSYQNHTVNNVGLVTDMPVLGVMNSTQRQKSTIVPVNNKYIVQVNVVTQSQTSNKISELTLYQKPLISNNSSMKTKSDKLVLYSP